MKDTCIQERTVRASRRVPQKRAVNMQMRICAFPSPHASQRLGVHRLKLKNNLRGVWPFVTDVQDNSINTTTKGSGVPAFSAANKPLWPLQTAWQHKKRKGKRYNLGEIISKKSPQCFTNAGTRVGISELRNLYRAEAYHISCLYLPRCNGRYDNRSAWRKLKQHGPPRLNATERRKNEKMIGFRQNDWSRFCQQNIRLQPHNGLMKCRHSGRGNLKSWMENLFQWNRIREFWWR